MNFGECAGGWLDVWMDGCNYSTRNKSEHNRDVDDLFANIDYFQIFEIFSGCQFLKVSLFRCLHTITRPLPGSVINIYPGLTISGKEPKGGVHRKKKRAQGAPIVKWALGSI